MQHNDMSDELRPILKNDTESNLDMPIDIDALKREFPFADDIDQNVESLSRIILRERLNYYPQLQA